MSYEDYVDTVVKQFEAADMERIRVENWLKIHQWVFVPAAFLAGIALGRWA